MDLSGRELFIARILIAVEAAVLTTAAGYATIDSLIALSKPLHCDPTPDQLCLDFRGLGLGVAPLLAPMVLLLFATVWWLRRISRRRLVLALLPQIAFLLAFAYGLLEIIVGAAQGLEGQVEIGLGVLPLATTILLIAAWRKALGQNEPGLVGGLRE